MKDIHLLFQETEELGNKIIEVGDTVVCVEGETKGTGWVEGYEFVVTKITDQDSRLPIYWKAKGDNGVFADSIKLVKKR